MSKDPARSVLYQLIAAGQLTHAALLAPLRDRGLEAGDDALLLSIGDGISERELLVRTGFDRAALDARIERLISRDILASTDTGPSREPGVVLTPRGERVREVIEGYWQELENALLGELDRRARRRLGQVLERFVHLLELES